MIGRQKRLLKAVGGFTLTEMMVSMAIALAVLAGIAQIFTVQTRQNSAEEQIGQMQQNVRGALDLMLREIRMAGYKPSGGTFNGIHTSTETTLRIKLVLDGTGFEPHGAMDDISYTFDSAAGQIVRTLNIGPSSAVLADNISVFSFSYLDANGAPTTTSSAVRRITISITAQTAKPDPSYPNNNGHRTYQLSAHVTPPNLAL
ncbi:MAG TPA: prepilin-type N-terminal cleavage/methylation domain-containing protein [Verrucomicrobiae bacterium]|nr:prepilin-type N-terminal cleavage/methylation domain-containing protein [Verrucomicrobiae bacterium]